MHNDEAEAARLRAELRCVWSRKRDANFAKKVSFATKEMRRPAASPKRTEDGASPCASNPKEMRRPAASPRRTEDGASPCVSNPKEMRHLAASSKRTAKAEADRLRAELRRLTESV